MKTLWDAGRGQSRKESIYLLCCQRCSEEWMPVRIRRRGLSEFQRSLWGGQVNKWRGRKGEREEVLFLNESGAGVTRRVCWLAGFAAGRWEPLDAGSSLEPVASPFTQTTAFQWRRGDQRGAMGSRVRVRLLRRKSTSDIVRAARWKQWTGGLRNPACAAFFGTLECEDFWRDGGKRKM